MNRRVFLTGLLLAFVGLSMILAVFIAPIKNQTLIRTYEKKEEILHDIENHDVEAQNYFVSVYIERGRNVYTRIKSNTSIDMCVVPLEEWNSSISEGREYDKVYARYLNVSNVDSYFNAPEGGYYVFEVIKVDTNYALRLNSFMITATWSELAENLSEPDYNYSFVIWGGILATIGSSIALYQILPKQTPQGILLKRFSETVFRIPYNNFIIYI